MHLPALSVPYLSGLLLLPKIANKAVIESKPFSPLFIGIIIVTERSTPNISPTSCLSVPYLSGLLLLLGPCWRLCGGEAVFQSPIYRDYYCYSYMVVQAHKTSVFQSPIYRDYYCYHLVRNGLFDTADFQSPIYRDYYCYCFYPTVLYARRRLSVPYLSGLLLLPRRTVPTTGPGQLSVPYLSGLLLLPRTGSAQTA